MRIFLATLSHLLPQAMNLMLNLQNEYRAIIVDEPKPAKDFLSKIGYPENLVYSYYELSDCLKNFYFDYVLCVSDDANLWGIHKRFYNCGFPRENFINLCLTQSANNDFMVKRTLQYYNQHSDDFDMFATGISYTAVALDTNKFRLKLINFGRSSQDLYYDYQIAKSVLTPKIECDGGGGYKN